MTIRHNFYDQLKTIIIYIYPIP